MAFTLEELAQALASVGHNESPKFLSEDVRSRNASRLGYGQLLEILRAQGSTAPDVRSQVLSQLAAARGSMTSANPSTQAALTEAAQKLALDEAAYEDQLKRARQAADIKQAVGMLIDPAIRKKAAGLRGIQTAAESTIAGYRRDNDLYSGLANLFKSAGVMVDSFSNKSTKSGSSGTPKQGA